MASNKRNPKDEVMEDHEEEEDDDEIKDVDDPEVLNYYKLAATAVNAAMNALLKDIVPNKKVVDLCILGDKYITDNLAAVQTAKGIKKGSAFPTCVSVNHIAGHVSPLREDAVAVLKEGDVVKIDMGAHVNGYPSLAAHTVIATANPTQPTTGRKADAIAAAHYCSEAVLRLLRPGKKNTDVTNVISQIATQFKCQPLEGVLSHRTRQHEIDATPVILNKETLDQKADEAEFENNTVYTVDIVISTGEGKAKETDARCTVFKLNPDQSYKPKLDTTRMIQREVNKKYPDFAFSLRNLDNEKKARLGISEMAKHNLVQSFPVLAEKNGTFIAQFKFTVIILPTGQYRLNQFNLPFVQSECKIESPEINALLAEPTTRNPTPNVNDKKMDTS